MKKLILLLIPVILSCSDKTEEVPQGVLPKNKMVELLIKIHIAEAKAGVKSLPGDSAKKLFYAYEGRIFQQEKVDKKVYNKSYKYYVSKPELIDEIYSAVVDSLSLREGRGVLD